MGPANGIIGTANEGNKRKMKNSAPITKLLILSDSHRNIDRMLSAVKQTSPDAVVHLGDHISDAFELQEKLPGAAFYMVAGNCDPQSLGQSEMLLSIESVKIYLTHGHNCRVKSGLSLLAERAGKLGADLALFGHTHGAKIEQAPGVILMNPGQMERHDEKRRASYGIVTVKDGKFDCEIVYLPKNAELPLAIT